MNSLPIAGRNVLYRLREHNLAHRLQPRHSEAASRFHLPAVYRADAAADELSMYAPEFIPKVIMPTAVPSALTIII